MILFKKILFLILLVSDLYLFNNLNRPIYLSEILENRLVFWSYMFLNAYFLADLISYICVKLDDKL